MKKAIFLLISLFLVYSTLNSSPVIFKYDNGTPGGFYSQQTYFNWDETAMLKPPGPCKINKVQIYLSGTVSAADTIWIVGDPAEGAFPPSSYCWYINKLTEGKVINYTGIPGWFEIDISSDNIKADGICSVVIQHRIKQNGPFFTFDNQSQTQGTHSWLIDPRANPDFYDIGGTIFARSQGNFMVRVEIEYDFPDGETTAMAPPPTLVDVTKEAGLVDGNGNPIKSPMLSVVGFNNNEFEDLAISTFYFKNNGNGTFTNISHLVNIQESQTSWADIDNDGNIDHYEINDTLGNDRILWGKGDYTFIDETDPGIKLTQPTVTPMFFDYNHDGLLDIYIAYGRAGSPEVFYADQLFKNRGFREFENVTNSAGIMSGEPAPYYDCWGASICDYNNDNWPDAFVATYRLAPDMLFKNAKNGMFNEVGSSTGARGIPTYYAGYFGHGMGSDWGDFNNDGYDDLCVGNLGHPDSRALNSNPSLLFKNDGPPNWTFTDMHSEMGLKFFEMNAGTVWADLNLDGFLDLVHAQYSYYAKGVDYRYTRFYINQGPDKNFKLKDITWESGSYCHGAWTPVRIDYDNDGDMDIIVASDKENLKLFRNDLLLKGNWIAFRLVGNPADNVPNEGFGSNVTVYSGSQKFYRSLPGTVMNGRCSQSSNELNFGLGTLSAIDSVIIKYPNGQSIKFTGLMINTKYKIPYMQSPIRMKLTAPMLIYPLNFTIKMLPDVSFDWTQVSEGVKYELLISDNYNFTDSIVHQTDLTQTLLSNYTFLNNTTYFWKVRAYDEVDTGNWSSVWEFTTGIPTPLAPNLIIPENNSVNVSAKPKFIWKNSEYFTKFPGITTYDMQICSDPQCSTSVISLAGLTDTTYLHSGVLIPESKYYWRTRGINEGTLSKWSDIWNFIVMPLPVKPVLTSPANGDSVVKTRPTFIWDSVANTDYYELEISKSESFLKEDSVYFLSKIETNSKPIFKLLNKGTKYFWHIRAVNSGGTGEWSDAFYFITEGILGVNEMDNSNIFVTTSPNPFDKVTNIEFYLSEPGFTTLKILNIEGIELETILSEKLDEGNHLVKWDAKLHPTGIYYYQLINGNKSYTGKLIVLK